MSRRGLNATFHAVRACPQCGAMRDAALDRGADFAHIAGDAAIPLWSAGIEEQEPVFYEVCRIVGVHDDVRMQLCVGTSLAIIGPTTIRSYLAHREKGAVVHEV